MIAVMNAQRQSRVLYAAGVVAPLVAVVLIRFSGPATTRASTPPPPAPEIALPRLDPPGTSDDARLTRARERARQLEDSGTSASPFRDIGVAPTATGASSNTPGDEPTIEVDPEAGGPELPNVRVSAIVSMRRGSLAVVDDRLRCEGDLVAAEWALLAIDARGRRVVLRHISGVRREVVLSTP